MGNSTHERMWPGKNISSVKEMRQNDHISTLFSAGLIPSSGLKLVRAPWKETLSLSHRNTPYPLGPPVGSLIIMCFCEWVTQ